MSINTLHKGDDDDDDDNNNNNNNNNNNLALPTWFERYYSKSTNGVFL
jgi:hypothetical protein